MSKLLGQVFGRSPRDEVRAGRVRHAPSDDAPGEHVDNEGDIGKTLPGRNIGKVRHPQHIGRRRPERKRPAMAP